MARPLDKAAHDEWLTLQGELTNGFALRYPLDVHVWIAGAEWAADAPRLNLHSYGDNRDEAIANLKAEIVDQLRLLREQDEQLSPAMADQRDLLTGLLVVPDGLP